MTGAVLTCNASGFFVDFRSTFAQDDKTVIATGTQKNEKG
jgi:hypothetical protein